jgi:hypothetical protein
MIVAGAAALIMWCTGAASAATGWTIQTTPVPAGARESYLQAVSCVSGTSCTAVGYYRNSAGALLTLAENWNGTAWEIQATPNPAGTNVGPVYLDAVSCASATSCTAVGHYASPSGQFQFPLAEYWDGTAWAIQAVPRPGRSSHTSLEGVSCRTATSCIAVGQYLNNSIGAYVTLAEHWNGTAWQVQATPNPAGATPSQLDGVWCTSATSCTAAGHYRGPGGVEMTLAEIRNGSTWAIQATPNPAGSTGSYLQGVSCHSAISCTATGHYSSSAGAIVTLAEHWNGTAWAVQATPNPAHAADNSQLGSVSCASPSSCTAAGWYATASGGTRPLAEHWNGSTWAIQATPNPAGATFSYLEGVSCALPSSCTATGWFAGPSGQGIALAEAT